MVIDPSRVDEVQAHLRDDIVSWARQQSGFVSGQWHLTADQRSGLGVVAFVSEKAATAAADGPRNFPHDDARAWNIDDVTVQEQIASA
jgi:hypothetical protein